MWTLTLINLGFESIKNVRLYRLIGAQNTSPHIKSDVKNSCHPTVLRSSKIVAIELPI